MFTQILIELVVNSPLQNLGSHRKYRNRTIISLSVGLPFFNNGVTLAFFQSDGTIPEAKDIIILANGLAIISAESLKRYGDMLSSPHDLLDFNFLSWLRMK